MSTPFGFVLDHMIHPDQSYTVPGRSIHDNPHLVQDLIHHSQGAGLSSAFLSLDQEKAFDRMDHRINCAKCSGLLVCLWETDSLPEELRPFTCSRINLLYLGVHLCPAEESWLANWQELETKSHRSPEPLDRTAPSAILKGASSRHKKADCLHVVVHCLNYDVQLLYINLGNLRTSLQALPVFYQDLLKVWNTVASRHSSPPSGVAALEKKIHNARKTTQTGGGVPDLWQLSYMEECTMGLAGAVPFTTGCQVDFQFEKNNKEHRTDKISIKRLIVRRGQSFNIKVNFKDGFNPAEAKLKMVFETGPEPKNSNGTKIEVLFTKSLNLKRWSGIITSSTSSELCIAISPSPRAKTGYHRLTLQHAYDTKVQYYLGNFVVLFNPWCSEDEVFLNSDSQRDEYVMNETGIIYVGSRNHMQGALWNFGQFEEDILDICLKLLDKTPKYLKNPYNALSSRGFSVHIARIVSAMVNSNDDTGILFGRWSSPYSGGVHPGKWNGSPAILRKWSHSDCKAVRYGQCWVFAAVTCTVLRCLGIPTRVVTNFDSAHDTDANLIIDVYYDVGTNRPKKSKDMIWNFHVWNETWMARNDLSPGYDGWQAVDATPQERSNGIYCCGPAPVTAIKEGEMEMKYDVPFIFAEVNAHCVDWLISEDGEITKMEVDKSRVGHKISTKRCGAEEREDITSNYKYPDGSIQEEDVFAKASIIQNVPVPAKTLNVSMTTDLPIYNGNPFTVSMVISNETSQGKVCDVRVWAQKKNYSGVSENEIIKRYKQEITIPPNEDLKIPLKFVYKEYGLFPDMYNLIRLISVVTDVSSKSRAFAIKDLSLVNPPLMIKMLSYSAVLNKKVEIEISFQNHFPEILKDCVMTLEGAGLIEGEKEIKFPNVAPYEFAKVKCDFVPYKLGLKKLLVDFDCDKLRDVKGSLNIIVLEKERAREA
ncbi:protein-glutamine gamma-glutamyltransferase 2-like [Mustelus asterias]